ncbi:anti-sigma factor antagonist [bacterium]|nr:anti-sigma factor antagonist [bacterium]
MELVKTELGDGMIKIQIGATLDSSSQQLTGPIELDIENQAQFVDLINMMIVDEGVSRILVDMSHVSYVDSSGLWALFEGHKKATQKNGKLVLLNPTKDVRRVLEITKIASKIHISDSEDEAIASLMAK